MAMNSNAMIVTIAMTATEISRYAGAKTPGVGSRGRRRVPTRWFASHPRWCSLTRVYEDRAHRSARGTEGSQRALCGSGSAPARCDTPWHG